MMKKNNRIKKVIEEAVGKTLKQFFHPVSFFDLESVSDEELKRQSLGFRFTVAYGNNFSYNGNNVLKEDVIETVNPTETIKEIKEKFRLSDWQIDIEKGANNINLLFIIPNIEKDKQLLIDAMSVCGWSFSCDETKTDRLGNVWIAMSFDPMFQDDISDEAKKFKFLYHWSPEYNVQSILKNGLVPKSENDLFKYQSRIHLIKGNISSENIVKIGQLLCSNNKNLNNDGNYDLFAIETNKLPENFSIYYDPRFEYGYYAKEIIPQEAIILVKKIKFKI